MTTMENGIYIPYKGKLIKPEEWAKQADPTIATSVVLITDFASIEIAKFDLGREYNFEEAQKAAAKLGEGWRCPTRHEAIEIYDSRFKGLDKALELIGGASFREGGCSWTCEEDIDPDYYPCGAFYVSGQCGVVNANGKSRLYPVWPVATYKNK